MTPSLELLAMLVRENLLPGRFERQPEPSSAMDSPDQVGAFDSQGGIDGPMAAIYHLVAQACSRLTPRGGLVVDLGCGTGRFAAFLAVFRPDVRILGLDLSPLMVEMGNASLRAAGLADRAQLRLGDMTDFADRIPGDTALLNCLFALHHLPSLQDVNRCLAEFRRAEQRTGCGFLLLDLVRPRHRETAAAYPRAFMPRAPRVFQEDTANSLLAAYEHGEIAQIVEATFGRDAVCCVRSRFLPLYQAYWRTSPLLAGGALVPEPAVAATMPLPGPARRQLSALRFILPGFPG